MRVGFAIFILVLTPFAGAVETLTKGEVEDFFNSNPCGQVRQANYSQATAKLHEAAKQRYDQVERQTQQAEALKLRSGIPKHKQLSLEQQKLMQEIRAQQVLTQRLLRDLKVVYDRIVATYDANLRARQGTETPADLQLAKCSEHLSGLDLLLKVTSQRILNPNWEIAIRFEQARLPLRQGRE